MRSLTSQFQQFEERAQRWELRSRPVHFVCDETVLRNRKRRTAGHSMTLRAIF
jgi:hypothetical protein